MAKAANAVKEAKVAKAAKAVKAVKTDKAVKAVKTVKTDKMAKTVKTATRFIAPPEPAPSNLQTLTLSSQNPKPSSSP